MVIEITAGMTEAEKREAQLLNLVPFSLQGKCELDRYDVIIKKLRGEDVQTDAIKECMADVNFVKAERYSSEAGIYFSKAEEQKAEDLGGLKEEGIEAKEQSVSELVQEYLGMSSEYRGAAVMAARDALGLFDELYPDGSVEYRPHLSNMPETLKEVKEVLSAIVGKAS